MMHGHSACSWIGDVGTKRRFSWQLQSYQFLYSLLSWFTFCLTSDKPPEGVITVISCRHKMLSKVPSMEIIRSSIASVSNYNRNRTGKALFQPLCTSEVGFENLRSAVSQGSLAMWCYCLPTPNQTKKSKKFGIVIFFCQEE